jgi:hypothetical protein
MSGIMLNVVGGTFAPSLPAIGSALGGGFFAGQIDQSGTKYNLIVGPVSSAQNASKKWKTTLTNTSGTSSVIDGPTNSSNMNNASHPAAQFCLAVSAGGFSDWYMPAKNELEVCYYNLKPTTTVNSGLGLSSGINANAVPARTGYYTSGTPSQTSASDFQDTGAEDFTAGNYWSSTEYSTYRAWRQYFSYGGQYYFYKTTSHNVRAVRRVLA